jgi:hypothetical protein
MKTIDRMVPFVAGSPPLKPLRVAVIAGGVSAIVTWVIVYSVLHEPNPRRISDTVLVWVSHADNNEVLRACAWASVAYVLVFTPTLLLLNQKVLKSPFQTAPMA